MSNTAESIANDASRSSLVRLAVFLSIPAVVIVYAVAFHLSIADLGLDSRAYPQGIIVVLLLVVLTQVFSEIRDWWRNRETMSISDIWKSWRRTVLAILCTAAFVWGIGVIGFYESLALYGFVLLPLLGVRRPVTVIAFNVGVVAGVYILFDLLLSVRLPGGLLVG